MKPLHTLIFLGVTAILLSSCATHNLFETKDENHSAYTYDSTLLKEHFEHTIKKDDKVSVSIWNHDDLSVGSLFGIYNSNEVYGKWVLVNEEGEVVLPRLGRVILGGLTTTEAAKKLELKYSEYIVEPIIVVKVLNREVTVLGEVKNPGSFLLEKEENTLFEILGKAGGLEFYAEMREVGFIRNGKKTILDLTKMDDFVLNNIMMQDGDIINVPTKKGKTVDKKAPTMIPFASVITAAILLITLISSTQN